MTQNTSPGTTNQGNSPITLVAIVIGVIVVGAVAYKAMHKESTAPDNTASATAAPTDSAPAAPSKVNQAHDPTATLAAASPATSATAAASSSVPAAKPVVTGPAKDLVNSLAAIDPKKGPITKEQAEQWKQNLKALIAQGKDAVPAIREFLDRNVELSYQSGQGESLGYSSLRSSLIDALAQIGGPDATSALLGTLQTSALPSELQQISRALEQMAPGQYTQDIMNAARQTLDLALNGSLGKEDAGPLFDMLKNDPNAIQLMEKAASAYKYYPVFTLADMADGQGVPALVDMANKPNMPSTVPEGLAQAALGTGANAEAAADELVKLASSGRLTPSELQGVIAALEGQKYQITAAQSPNQTPQSAADCQYFHIEWNNQNFSRCKNPNFQPTSGVNILNKLLGGVQDPNMRSSIGNAVNQLQGH